jgi:hypothetical protein
MPAPPPWPLGELAAPTARQMVDTGVVTGRRIRSKRRGVRLCAAVLLGPLALVGAACSSTGYSYVKDSDDRTYFKVPDQWTLFDQDALVKGLSPRERDAALETSWQVGFDASPKPRLGHLLDPSSKHPTGIASVEELDFDSSDNASLATLRNYFIDVDSALDAGQAEIVAYEPLEPDGGFRGFHLVFDLELDGGRTITFDQTTLMDQSSSKLYNLIITCGARCYADNQDKIERVVDSWTVEA